METTKQIIVVREDLKMPAGKVGAQAAHASLGAVKNMMRCKDAWSWELNLGRGCCMDEWWNGSWTKILLGVNSEQALLDLEQKAKEASLITCLVTDNGRTVFNGVPTVTCLAIGPGWDSQINKVTGHLRLYKGN